MAAEPLGPDLLSYVLDTYYEASAPERRRSRWVMSTEWLLECRKMAPSGGRALWEPAPGVQEVLCGLPIEVREDGGLPHLEPVP